MSGYTVARLFPSFISLTGLCSGLLSIRFALAEQWEFAMFAIVVAGFLDAIDGKVARILRTDSAFGAQLDSLCDLVNFGVCPGLVIYLWGFTDVKIFGWTVVVLYVACMAIRLARFNAEAVKHSLVAAHRAKKSKVKINSESRQQSIACVKRDMFFVGVPAPAGATLVLLPVILSLSANLDDVFDQRFTITQVELYVLFVSLLLVSPLPTFSLKAIRIKKQYTYLAMACFALLVLCCIMKPWIVIPVICIGYFVSMPLSVALRWWMDKRPKDCS